MSRRSAKREAGPFAMLPVDVLRSAACRTLPHPARSVLVVLAAQYSGRDNGSLTLTKRTARDYGLGRPDTLYRSLAELEARGLILRTRPGTRRPPRSAMYAIAWRQIDDPLQHDPHDERPTLTPSHAYSKWSPAQNGPHWTSERRSPRYRIRTSVGTACEPKNGEMGTACEPKNVSLRVPHTYPSHISGGVGDDLQAPRRASA